MNRDLPLPWSVSLGKIDYVDWARELIRSRQNSSPRRLIDPGPSQEELKYLLEAAAAAPDHGRLTPWRFIEVSPRGRPALGEAFRQALLARDAAATDVQQAEAMEKAFRSPSLLIAVLDVGANESAIPFVERSISLGCAIQNMLLLAQTMGYGSGLSSGKSIDSAPLRSTFGLGAHEAATCFVSFGTVLSTRPPRLRPNLREIFTRFPPSGGAFRA